MIYLFPLYIVYVYMDHAPHLLVVIPSPNLFTLLIITLTFFYICMLKVCKFNLSYSSWFVARAHEKYLSLHLTFPSTLTTLLLYIHLLKVIDIDNFSTGKESTPTYKCHAAKMEIWLFITYLPHIINDIIYDPSHTHTRHVCVCRERERGI